MSKELLELLQRTRVRKYHKSDPKKLLLGMVEEIKMKTGHYGYRSWEMMVEYLAKWLVLNEKTGLASMVPLQGFKGLNLEKDEIYKHLESLDLFRHYYTAALAKPWDYVGEVYTDLGCVGMGQNMTPRGIVELMIKCTYATRKIDGEAECLTYGSYLNYAAWYTTTYNVWPNHLRRVEPPIHTQLDPCVGTGRFLFIASQMMPKANLVLFGIEISPALYRACLINMAMFSNHPYSIICADSLMLDQKFTGPSSKLWDSGNQWDPPNLSAFYFKPSPINANSFSLKHFVEEVQGKK